jgi:hypothetical protein
LSALLVTFRTVQLLGDLPSGIFKTHFLCEKTKIAFTNGLLALASVLKIGQSNNTSLTLTA